MKNMIKMSLVAAVAVAGLSSTVAAKPLAEAIKDVDVSGTVVYRFEDYSDDKGATNSHTNNYKIASTIKSKVNDTITASVRVVAGNSANGSFASLDTTDGADANPSMNVTNANFTAKVAGATVIVGKQGIATPWTKAVDSDGDEQTGTGALALVPVGPVTLAAGVFNQTNLDQGPLKAKLSTTDTALDTQDEVDAANGKTGSQNVAVAAVLAKVGPVALDAWYLDMEDTFSTYTVGAKASIDMITVDARHTSLDLDSATTDNSISYLKVTAKAGPATVWANYAMTDKEGGLAALQATAKTNVIGWKVHTLSKADADMFMVGAKMDVMSGLNVALNYNTIDYKSGTTDMEQTELYTQITHTMGKNFSTYLRYGTYTAETANVETADSLRARLQVEYKF